MVRFPNRTLCVNLVRLIHLSPPEALVNHILAPAVRQVYRLIFLKSTQKSVSINGLSIRGYENAKKCQLICPQYVKNIPYFQYKIE